MYAPARLRANFGPLERVPRPLKYHDKVPECWPAFAAAVSELRDKVLTALYEREVAACSRRSHLHAYCFYVMFCNFAEEFWDTSSAIVLTQFKMYPQLELNDKSLGAAAKSIDRLITEQLNSHTLDEVQRQHAAQQRRPDAVIARRHNTLPFEDQTSDWMVGRGRQVTPYAAVKRGVDTDFNLREHMREQVRLGKLTASDPRDQA